MVVWVGYYFESCVIFFVSVLVWCEVEFWVWLLGLGECYVLEFDVVGWWEMVLVIEGCLCLELVDGEWCIEVGDFYVFVSD